MNILIIRLSSMGDVILATPLFSVIKKNWPQAQVNFLTSQCYTELFTSDQRLQQVLGLSQEHFDNVVSSLDTTSWDLIVDLQNNRRSKRILKALSHKKKICKFNKMYLQRILLLFFRINLYGIDDYIAYRYLRTCGIDFDFSDPSTISPTLIINAENLKSDLSEFFSSDTLAIIPFGAWKNKRWPIENYVEVGRCFSEKGWNIAIFGGPQDAAESEILQQKIGYRSKSFSGKISLRQTALLLSKCSLALGNDTGLLHMARACGVKAGVIFGPTSRHFGFYPYGQPPFTVFEKALRCRPCHPHGGDFCWRISRPCLSRIKPATVIKGLETLLQQ